MTQKASRKKHHAKSITQKASRRKASRKKHHAKSITPHRSS
jgi:hypothetical protein